MTRTLISIEDSNHLGRKTMPSKLQLVRTRRRAFLKKMIGAAALTSGAHMPFARAQSSAIRIAYQPGLNYLPLMIVERLALLEKHLSQKGNAAKISWSRFSSGAPMNDALLSGQIDIASGGSTVLAVLWGRTRGKQDVRGLTALAASPIFLNSARPKIKSLKDFGPNDRIALPTVRTSPNAVVLQMASEMAFGRGEHGRLDALTVSMANPEAHAALLSGNTEIVAHMAAPPFSHLQLRETRIHRVLSSSEVVGIGATNIVTWTSKAFRDGNRVAVQAFLAALSEANGLIQQQPSRAAQIYLEAMNAKNPPELIESILKDPEISFSVTPKNSLRMIEFLQRTGTLKSAPSDWRDLFFEDIHELGGS